MVCNFSGLLEKKEKKKTRKKNPDNIDNKRQEEIKIELSRYEKSTQPGILDHAITEKEISEACKKLKNNKASAHDMIKMKRLRQLFL